MAPEFFPFFAFAGLAVLVLAGLFVAVAFLIWARYSKSYRKLLRVLSILAFCGTVAVGILLLGLGWIIRQQSFLNEPFASACAAGNLDEAKRLFSKGASPNSYGIDGAETALTGASHGQHVDVVEFLLRNGADVSLKNIEGKTALECAQENGDSNIVAMLQLAMKSH